MTKLLRSFQALALLELIAFAGVAMAQQMGAGAPPRRHLFARQPVEIRITGR